MELSKKRVSELQECIQKDLLTYVYYPASQRRCFAYPQYMLSGDKLLEVENSAFPDAGCLPLAVGKSYTSESLDSLYGPIVILTVNDLELERNYNYPNREQHRYNGVIDPDYKHKRVTDFKRFSQHKLSSLLIQVIEVEEQIDFSKPFEESVHIAEGCCDPQTKLILVSQVDNNTKFLYGPFERTNVVSSELKLQACSGGFDLRVGRFAESELRSLFSLNDDEGHVVAQFVDSSEFKKMFDARASTYDWVSYEDLLAAIQSASKTELGLTKSKSREFAAALRRYADVSSKVVLDDVRRNRMAELIEGYNDWSSLPEDIKTNALENADPAVLAEYVLSDEHFSAFYDKAMESTHVRERVDQAIARHEKLEKEAVARERLANEKREEAERALHEIESQYEQKRREIAESVESETVQAREERDSLLEEIGDLKANLEKLRENEVLLKRAIKDTVDKMSDSVTVSKTLLEDEMIRQIVESMQRDGSESENQKPEKPSLAVAQLFPNHDDLGVNDAIGIISNCIVEQAGRDYDTNEIINLMICLTQGYITTFAGVPGTGKTSLARIIAGALGLTQKGSERFVEVSVERGWTSYKDFIGYYNPFTKTLEQSNVEAFNSFCLLSEEAHSEDGALPPFFVLLDEANLSSVEHYWAPFLRACDSFQDGPLSLPLGGDSELLVPSHTRFIATVNFDHTTEELSQRFLDRSWVITLDAEPMDFLAMGNYSSSYDFGSQPAFTAAKLQSLFGVPDDHMPKADLASKLHEVITLCYKNNHVISPRSQKMMRDYVCAAGELMDLATAESAYSPVDYAVAQKILPMLSGGEDKLEGLLTDLRGVSGLPITANRIEHMLEVGGSSGFYQYFA